MDFGDAALLTVVLLGLGQQVKSLVFGTNDQRKTTGLVLGTAVATTFLVAESAWGNEQIVAGRSLDQLGWSSLILVAIVLSGMASTGWEVLTAVKNVGTPMPPRGVRYGEFGEVEAQDHVAANDRYGLTQEDADRFARGEGGDVSLVTIGAVCGIIALVVLLIIIL